MIFFFFFVQALFFFWKRVTERIIQGCTDNTSIDTLHKYEKVTEQQELAISKILSRKVISCHSKNDHERVSFYCVSFCTIYPF